MDLITKQVPQYLLIGRGRVARHFSHYFNLLHIHFKTWHRDDPAALLTQFLQNSTHVLVLLRDQVIDSFIRTHQASTKALFIHFSGSLVSPLAYGAHPLMTFNEHLYSLEEYLQIPFIIEENALPFNELLPGLPNLHYYLNPAMKAKYHALCVLAGNFSCILWQKLFHSLENELGLPKSAAYPFLKKQTLNLLQDSRQALTGPLTRNDNLTLQKNITALAEDPFQEIYQAFINCYRKNEEFFK